MLPKPGPAESISPRCRSGSRARMRLGTNPSMHLHTPGWGEALCGLRGVLAAWHLPWGMGGHSHPVLPVPRGDGSSLQAALTAECLHESCHQALRSVGACTGSNRWVYFSNQVMQVVPLIIPLHFYLSVLRVFIFCVSAVP